MTKLYYYQQKRIIIYEKIISKNKLQYSPYDCTKIEKEGTFPNSCYEAMVTLSLKPYKDPAEIKEITDLLMNNDTKILSKILAN